MQSQLNDVVTCEVKGESIVRTNFSIKQADSARNVFDKIETLKRYKNLLDSGVITQEEFDQKKNDILGLKQ